MTKPLTLWCLTGGVPNPIKVAILLEELGVPYEYKVLTFAEVKGEEFLKISPNGRAPAIEDPNTGVTIWESGAIFEYLVEEYDKEGKIHSLTKPASYLEKQWLFFQVSGQGPYYGQAVWFNQYHHEQLPSAQKRYMDETLRVVGVLDRHLSTTSSGWLVGDQCTYADLAFVTWNEFLPFIFSKSPENWNLSKYPSYKKWTEALKEKESVKKGQALQAKLMGQ